MQAKASTSVKIEDLFIRATLSNRISESDWQQLESALLEDSFTQEDKRLIKRIVHSVRRGWFSVSAS